MNILVTGSNGQLGSEIRKIAADYAESRFTFIDIDDLDLTNLQATRNFLDEEKPECIINCAAYTAVDKAEQEHDLAMKLNGDLPGQLADFCKTTGSLLIHISTDYIFNGKGFMPYVEDDPADPQGYYAWSKLQGEKAILEKGCRGLILRTSWLYSEYGNNFVKTIYSKAKTNDMLRVVCDQVGTPTYAADLASFILQSISSILNLTKTEIYHYSNEGAISWYDFAKAITELGNIHSCEIIPIETKEYPTPAKRPFYSVLNKTRVKQDFGIKIPYWKDSLEKCMARLSTDRS